MTRNDLFAMTYGPQMNVGEYGQNYFTSDNWRADRRTNPGLLEASPDDQAMAYEQQAAELAHRAQMQGRGNAARQKVQFLQRMLASPYIVNTAYAPRSQDEQQFQGIVQQDVNQRNAGVGLMVAIDEQRKKEAQQRLNNQLKARDQALAEMALQSKDRDRATQILLQSRGRDIQQDNLDRKDANDQARQYQAQTKDAFGMLQDGVPLAQVLQTNPNFTLQDRQQLYNYAKAIQGQAGKQYDESADQMRAQNNALHGAEDQAITSYRNRVNLEPSPDAGLINRTYLGARRMLPTWLGGAGIPSQEGEDQAAQLARTRIQNQFNKDKGLGKLLRYNPELDAYDTIIQPTDYIGDERQVQRYMRPQSGFGGQPGNAFGYSSRPQYQQPRQPAPYDYWQLPQQPSMNGLTFGDRYVDDRGAVRQYLPEGVMFGR